MHFCVNVVVRPGGVGVGGAAAGRRGGARAGAWRPARRPAARSAATSPGGRPGSTQALGLGPRATTARDLLDARLVRAVCTEAAPRRSTVATGPRVGVSAGHGRAVAVLGSPAIAAVSRRSTQAGGPAGPITAVTGAMDGALVSTTDQHVLDELAWRGLIALSTDGSARCAGRSGRRARSPLLRLRPDRAQPAPRQPRAAHHRCARFQRAGHRPLALVGGATGLIGDPGGRPPSGMLNDRSRRRLGGAASGARSRRSSTWRGDRTRPPIWSTTSTGRAPLSAIDFLRDIGKHFRVNRMLAKEAVSARLNSDAGISYTEFSYQILQAIDFLELYRRYGCTLQTGGTDQWGNLTAGVDLIHRVEGASVHALATPLITKADGTKFGKTEGGAVWLDPRADLPVRVLTSSGSTPTTATSRA